MTRPGSVLAMLLALVAVSGCDHLPFGYTPMKEIIGGNALGTRVEEARRL